MLFVKWKTFPSKLEHQLKFLWLTILRLNLGLTNSLKAVEPRIVKIAFTLDGPASLGHNIGTTIKWWATFFYDDNTLPAVASNNIIMPQYKYVSLFTCTIRLSNNCRPFYWTIVLVPVQKIRKRIHLLSNSAGIGDNKSPFHHVGSMLTNANMDSFTAGDILFHFISSGVTSIFICCGFFQLFFPKPRAENWETCTNLLAQCGSDLGVYIPE